MHLRGAHNMPASGSHASTTGCGTLPTGEQRVGMLLPQSFRARLPEPGCDAALGRLCWKPGCLWEQTRGAMQGTGKSQGHGSETGC